MWRFIACISVSFKGFTRKIFISNQISWFRKQCFQIAFQLYYVSIDTDGNELRLEHVILPTHTYMNWGINKILKFKKKKHETSATFVRRAAARRSSARSKDACGYDRPRAHRDILASHMSLRFETIAIYRKIINWSIRHQSVVILDKFNWFCHLSFLNELHMNKNQTFTYYSWFLNILFWPFVK